MFIVFGYGYDDAGTRIDEYDSLALAIDRARREMDTGNYGEVLVEIEVGYDTGNYETVYTA